MEQHKSFNKCHCSNPGFCPIFMRRMGTNPPDWKWCQKTSPDEREKYYKLLSRAPDTRNKKLLDFFAGLDKLNIDKKLYLMYYLTTSDKYSRCEYAQKTQLLRNEKIAQYINDQEESGCTIDDLDILCLGHSQKQFDTILDRPYLKKTNLNDINSIPYQDNKWAEARAFVPQKPLFSPSAKFLGFVTASWNIKYEAYTKIDYLHNWETTRILLNSKPKDNVVLCADIFCPCVWFPSKNQTAPKCILDLFFGEDSEIVADVFKKLFNIEITEHVKVPFSNQFICHRNIVEEYQEYLIDQEIFEKIIWIINDFAHKYMRKNYDKIQQQHLTGRIYGYFTEAINCFWFYNRRKNTIFLPNAERVDTWYDPYQVKERVEWTSTIS